jgi:hypothetical protein
MTREEARARLSEIGYPSLAEDADEIPAADFHLVMRDISASRANGDWDSDEERDATIAEARRLCRIIWPAPPAR